MARTTHAVVNIYTTLGEPVELEGLCEVCLHATLVRFPVHGLHDGGVLDLGVLVACVGCYQDRAAEDEREE